MQLFARSVGQSGMASVSQYVQDELKALSENTIQGLLHF